MGRRWMDQGRERARKDRWIMGLHPIVLPHPRDVEPVTDLARTRQHHDPPEHPES
jgi:hypothetical protein